MIEEAVRRFPRPTGSLVGGPGSTATSGSSGSSAAPDTTTRSSDPVSKGESNGGISLDFVVVVVVPDQAGAPCSS
jgi:hypothetical protein